MSKAELGDLNLIPSHNFAAQSLEVYTLVLFTQITQSCISSITDVADAKALLL